MTFPVIFHIAGHDVPAHMAFETIGYFVGFQFYLHLRRQHPGQRVPLEQMVWVLVGAVFGAFIGSKVLAWIESAPDYWAARHTMTAWMGGKTIVGGLLGGWAGVELAKKFLGIGYSTGDTMVFPLVIGIAIGRIGCFLTGLPDHTYGIRSSLPWAVNFGDGPRHPTQLYEIAFLLLLGAALRLRLRRPMWNGELFRLFLLSYLIFRFMIEFIKPRFTPWLGLSAIQVASLVGAATCIMSLTIHRRMELASAEPVGVQEVMERS